MTRLTGIRAALRASGLARRVGTVRELRGLAIEAAGPRTEVGELCAIWPGQSVSSLPPELAAIREPADLWSAPGRRGAILAEVVAIQPGRITLMPHGTTEGLSIGSAVVALGLAPTVGVGDALVGRVIDGFGRPLDGGPPPPLRAHRPLTGTPRNPLQRPRIREVLETGIRSIDGLLTLGRGQRVGIFAGSGVGKSTLLGMIARHIQADVNVIALVGERGREVREFVEAQLGAEGLRRSVVVVATADQPAPSRIRAAHAALAIAEHFREEGRHVLLTLDSITRIAMARREIGLSAGEPPTARGYTPSVFAELPALCERCGTSASGGSISALLTVLVEGDDLNEPVSDALRAILDGHVVLSRDLANQGQYPAIDLLRSASRVLPDVASAAERQQVTRAISLLALLERNRQVVELGAYAPGSNPELDAALACQPGLLAFLRQSEGGVPRKEALSLLAAALSPPAAPPPPGAAPAARTEAATRRKAGTR